MFLATIGYSWPKSTIRANKHDTDINRWVDTQSSVEHLNMSSRKPWRINHRFAHINLAILTLPKNLWNHIHAFFAHPKGCALRHPSYLHLCARCVYQNTVHRGALLDTCSILCTHGQCWVMGQTWMKKPPNDVSNVPYCTLNVLRCVNRATRCHKPPCHWKSSTWPGVDIQQLQVANHWGCATVIARFDTMVEGKHGKPSWNCWVVTAGGQVVGSVASLKVGVLLKWQRSDWAVLSGPLPRHNALFSEFFTLPTEFIINIGSGTSWLHRFGDTWQRCVSQFQRYGKGIIRILSAARLPNKFLQNWIRNQTNIIIYIQNICLIVCMYVKIPAHIQTWMLFLRMCSPMYTYEQICI